MFRGTKGLAPVFTLVPSILQVKILIVQAYIHGYEQLQNLTTRPHGTFMHLRHMTCQLIVFNGQPNADNGVLQLALCLDVAPQLETLHLDMVYLNLDDGGSDGVMEEEGSHMCLHESGFRCCNAQVKLACCILQNDCVLEHMEIHLRVAAGMFPIQDHGIERAVREVSRWAQLTPERFGSAEATY
ncbi:hypothetical protein ACQJBY_066760 [Aegilops geniculata]